MQSLANMFKVFSTVTPLNKLDSSSTVQDSNTETSATASAISLGEQSLIKFSGPTHSLPENEQYHLKMLGIAKRVKTDLFDPTQFNYWANVAICGGYVLDLIFGTEYSSDIDMYIYNVKSQEKVDAIAQSITKLVGGKTTFESKSVLTLTAKNGNKVQIINTSQHPSIESIITRFDINPCKVAYNGYEVILDTTALPEISSYTCDFAKVSISAESIQRLAKYVFKKGLGLNIPQSDMARLDPLYLFRESHGLNKFMQMSKLLANSTLQNIYKLLSIRVNFDSNALNACVKYRNDKAMMRLDYDDNDRQTKSLKGRSLQSQLKDHELLDLTRYDRFGRPEVFNRIRSGQYTFEELYNNQICDSVGFNVSVAVVMYEPNEDRVIEWIKSIHKANVKNMNRYDINYLTIASLLNRQKIVGFLMNKANYRDVMEIAVKEDNLALYKLAYCTHSSADRYLYDKKQLIEARAFEIYKELYGNGDDIIQDQESTNDTTDYSYLNDITTEDFILKYAEETSANQKALIAYLRSRSVKTIKELDKERVSSLPEVSQVIYRIYLDRINHLTSPKFNGLLSNVVTGPQYKTFTSVEFSDPLASSPLELKVQLIKIFSSRKVDPDYKFDNEFINGLIVHLDDPNMITETKFKRLLFENVLSKTNVGPGLKAFTEEHLRKTSDPSLYSTMLSNTSDHNLAYCQSILNQEYVRQENALGFTPCDIIVLKTITDYYNSKHKHGDTFIKEQGEKFLVNRRVAIRNINLSKPIIPYKYSPENEQTVRELLPELF